VCDREQLLQSISIRTADYRAGEIPAITPEYVNAWIRQFEQFGFNEQHQLTILHEIDRVLSRFYIIKVRAIAFWQNMIQSQAFFGPDPRAGVAATKFLRIQRKGNSQNELLDLIAEAVQQQYGLRLDDCGVQPNKYIYVDDCIYSGNTIAHDLEEWLPEAVERVPLSTFTFGSHSIGVYRLQKVRNRFMREKGISIQHISATNLQFKNNFPWDGNVSDCYWPRELALSDDALAYVEELKHRRQGLFPGPRLFRPNGNPHEEKIFSSVDARDMIEHAFLRAGLHIMSLPQNPNRNMRPMGYEYLESLGFGALPIFYRNISNNAPLALWWGDPNEGYPLNQWQPLFLRKPNQPGYIPIVIREHLQ